MKKRKSSAAERRELKTLARKCLSAWKSVVKSRAGRVCEACGKKKLLQAHHVENYTTNRNLRYDFHNGLALCARCHKFGWMSVHRSFCFTFRLMVEKREEDFIYLLKNYKVRFREEPTREYYLNKIKELEGVVK
jgi:hypothetical protein